MAKKNITRPATAETALLSDIRVGRGRDKRRLSDEEWNALVRMLAIKTDPESFDVRSLAPEGSYLARLLRHFDETDISYAIPLMKLVMVAASWLTQRGATLEVPGLGDIVPTHWIIGLAESGEAKTLASDEVMRILSLDGECPVSQLAAPGSDAQWIDDLAENNGSYWFQDEVGKFFNKVLTSANFLRIKPWMLDAYSHKPISNRLKGETQKRVIERPMFTFFGLTVSSTWKMDIDLSSMLDGFCQRMTYFIAPPRTDTDMFDHYLYFTGPKTEERRADLHELWQALCCQEGAAGSYTLNPDVLPYLEEWWRSLRATWGDTSLPKSFIRRTGFSLMRYLPVLHFLLGKARHPIDLETAELATRFAEYHLQSTLALFQDYHQNGTGQVQKVFTLRNQLQAEGKPATVRNINRKLSTGQRANLPAALIREIVAILNKIEEVPDLISADMKRPQKSGALVARLEEIRARLKKTERKRNERRLRNLRKAYLQDRDCFENAMAESRDGPVEDREEDVVLIEEDARNVVELSTRRSGT
ncbi:Protein of unknown function [Tranquillimonas alkanivorans]|uniref:DUF3987 domain-containing protein n=2 Tax=Tranquillimonas alkanivorans TaxID=441119 RepID=A0A1I5VBV6_9RHOB|nr:Protein of unknown function [Tranquillimonas alkanivorans]